MATPLVYADFQNLDDENRLRLTCAGTRQDLERQGIELREGLRLTLYTDDANDEGHPDKLLADGVVQYNEAEKCWVATIDWSAIRHESKVKKGNEKGTKGRAAMRSRSPKQELVWFGMQMLDATGLGEATEVSEHRDKFVLNPAHSAARRLTDRPEADGFVRSDKDSLLFRHPSNRFRNRLPESLQAKAMPGSQEKGLEFSWSRINENEIGILFRAVIALVVGEGRQ